MILLDYLHYLILLAVVVFSLSLYIKIYFNVRSVRYSLKGVKYFFVISIIFPFSFANYIYDRRNALTRKLYEDDSLNQKQRIRLKEFINSKPKLYFSFVGIHIMEFPKFIEEFSVVYAKWYEKKRNDTTNNDQSPLQEIKKSEIGKFPEAFNTMKERFI